jgi:hypothetical protein
MATQSNTVEIEYGQKICCPFCTQVIIHPDHLDEGHKVCSHTVYVAHDMGVEYVSDLLLEAAKSAGIDLDDEDADPREIMANSGIEGIHYVETYVPAPSFYGTYLAFSQK